MLLNVPQGVPHPVNDVEEDEENGDREQDEEIAGREPAALSPVELYDPEHFELPGRVVRDRRSFDPFQGLRFREAFLEVRRKDRPTIDAMLKAPRRNAASAARANRSGGIRVGAHSGDGIIESFDRVRLRYAAGSMPKSPWA